MKAGLKGYQGAPFGAPFLCLFFHLNKLKMRNLFNSIQMKRPKKNMFDLSHDVKLSLDPGYLVPTLCMEVVPGETIKLSGDALLRFAPLVSPVMHRNYVYKHYFFCPYRLLWDNWSKFITNTKIGSPAALPAFPTVDLVPGTLYLGYPLLDYFGIPNIPMTGTTERISALPMAAYNLIYNEYYRDQNLIDEIPYKLSDGDNSAMMDDFLLRRRAWPHDYFTSALPFAQKGESVELPLGTVELKDDWWTGDAARPNFVNNLGTEDTGDVTQVSDGLGGTQISINSATPQAYDPDGSLEVQPTTVNDLRVAIRIQEWLERNARGGTRYIENILAHFGVRSSDKRLQRPEYITGTKTPVVISEVLNTTGTDDAPQGNMAGHGISVGTGKYGTYTSEEHGYIICIMSVMPETSYQQGIERHFLKTDDPTQFYFPSFAHLGEQEVYNKEIYAFTNTGDQVFGYNPRYSEYKYMNSRVAGQFRTTLDFWHWGRIFGTQPALNEDFISCDPGKRIFAVDDGTQSLWAHVYHKIYAKRPMPKFGTPTL